MTKIEDMSEMERQSWITLLADGFVFAYFWQKTTHGFSPRLIHTDMADFGIIIIGVVIMTIIAHTAIALTFEARKRKEPYDKDERDIQIERKGAHWGYRLMQYGIGGVIVTMFLHAGVGEAYTPPISIKTPAEIIFALMVVSYVADLVKHGIMILAYRGAP
ncbi:MAG: hypothetical protein ACSHXY_06685 [Alphaproteobacteria bacterium]